MIDLLILLIIIQRLSYNNCSSPSSCNDMVTYKCRACLKLPDAAVSWFTASKICEDGSNRISKISDDESILNDIKNANDICPDRKSAVYVGFLYNQSSEKWSRTETHHKIKKTVIMESSQMHLGRNQLSFNESASKAVVKCSYILNGELFAVDCDDIKSRVRYVLCARRQNRCGYFDNVIRDCQSRSRNNLKFKCKAVKKTTKKNCRTDFNKLRFICPMDNSTKADCFTFLMQGARTWAYVALGVVGLAVLAMGSMACCFVFSAFSGLKCVKAALPGLEGMDAAQFKKSVEILKPLTNDTA